MELIKGDFLMKKLFVLVLVLFALSYGRTEPKVQNWNGWLDTVGVTDVLDSATVYYTKAFRLSDGEDVRILCKVNDTAEDGFADDSVNFEWGYQTGSLCLNSSGVLDTAWDDLMTVDTMTADSFGVAKKGVVDPTGALTRYYKQADTTNVTGYAVQSRWLVPEWDVIFRFYVVSLGGLQKGDAALDLEFQVLRRIYSQTRNR